MKYDKITTKAPIKVAELVNLVGWDQEKMRDREGDAQSSPWDILISVKLFLDGTKTEVCFPRGPQSQQARVNIYQQPLHNAISTSSDEFI